MHGFMDKLDQFLGNVEKDKQINNQKVVGEVKPNQNRPQPNQKNNSHRNPQNNQPRHPQRNPQNNPHRPLTKNNSGLLRVYPLGGFEEVGKNMTVFETQNDIVIIDMGLQFPEENMYGIDYVIPDISSLEPKKNKIRGILITHGHLDHIGAVQHLLPKLNFPKVYATPLTRGLIEKRIKEAHLLDKTKIQTILPNDKLHLGDFEAEFFRVNHSIPDCVGIALSTPAGLIIHTGDFKFDFTPSDQKPADFGKIASLGNRNVLALFSDSTNATEPGHTVSEKVIEAELDRVIEKAKGRVIVATFSSLIGRIDQVIQSALKHNRKVFLSGRSMEDNVEIASNLGYIKTPRGSIRKLDQLKSVPDRQAMLVTTGSQGEEMSALTRISLGTHQKIKIKPGDTVILSSSPIIGNEKAIVTVINNLIRLGAHVVTNRNLDVHTSGHGKQGDLKLMISLVRPRYLVPIHGELHMRAAHRDIAGELGIPEKDVALIDNGEILEFFDGKMRKSKSKITVNNIMIDGHGIGDDASLVQRERQTMSQSGMVIIMLKVIETGKLIADPIVISKGFLYAKEGKDIFSEVSQAAKKAYTEQFAKIGKMDNKAEYILREAVRHNCSKTIRKRINREPLILPILVQN